MSDESSQKCPQCGAPLPGNALGGLCPNCLMALNLKTETVFTDDAAAVAPPPLPPEQIAAHFPQLEVLECLGRGGMGVVYKARQKSLNRFVALKLLAPERVREARFAERFTREAQALAALNHPNIVTIYDFGQAGGFYYLLMEYVDGLNLRQLLRTRKFTPEEALAIVPPLCDALQFAHNRGIVHRDIKPENLLLNKEGRVKVADFGIAKMLGASDGSGEGGGITGAENVTLSTVGTPGYSAPEQAADPGHVDSRADIYSLGVVFYEMLTGELPGKRIEPPSRKVHIDVRLDEVVLRALERQPDLRYQQVSEVKTMVETIVGSPDSGENENKGPSLPVTSPAPKRRFRPLAIAGAILLSLAVILATFFQLARSKPIKSDYIGSAYFPNGDSIEITSVEQSGGFMTVKGHYNLVSQDQATLAFYVTTPSTNSTPVDPRQTMQVFKGRGDFVLIHTDPGSSWPHISMYGGGQSFADLYFGTQAQATQETKFMVKRAPALQFRLVAADDTTEPVDVFHFFGDGHGPYQIHVMRQILMDGSAVAGAGIGFEPDGQRSIQLQLTEAGKVQFKEITGSNIDRRLAIIYNGTLLSAPIIRGKIMEGRASINGSLIGPQINRIVDSLNNASKLAEDSWTFTDPQECVLAALPPPNTPRPRSLSRGWLNLDTDVITTNQESEDWRTRDGHEWVSTNGIDLVAAISSLGDPVLTSLDMVIVPVAATNWDDATPADVVQSWDLSQGEPRQEYLFGLAPGKSGTYLFQTREGRKGILQILGVTDDGSGVKLRYKRVQPSSLPNSTGGAVEPK